jgi:8-oxo-dGTP pyrophosphatase MutT (NUDIX family)
MPHIHEKIDFTVETFIVNGDAVLLRKHDKYGIWLAVGGHIEPDEDPVEAAVREVKEETGLDVQIAGETLSFDGKAEGREVTPPRFINRHNVNETHEHVAFVYFALSRSREVQQGQDEQSDDIRWCTKEDLKELPLKKHIRYYALEALKELGS